MNKNTTLFSSPLAKEDVRRTSERTNKKIPHLSPSSGLRLPSPAIGKRYPGFTLIELLVVVLIIGLLTAVALPTYRRAVDKSRFAMLLPTTRALKEAQEIFYISNGYYAEQMHDLDVHPPADTNYTLKTAGEESDYNVIQATHNNLNNVRLASYLDRNSQFAGQLHCEAKVGDGRANDLCNKLFMGNKLIATSDNYMGYLLNEEIGQQLCNNTSKFWSNSTKHCYQSQEEKCNAIGGEAQTGGKCAYNNLDGRTIGEDQICYATAGGDGNCSNSHVLAGGECVTGVGNHQTLNSACSNSIIEEGGICRVIGNSYTPCGGLTMKPGSMCILDADTNTGCSYMNNVQGAIICNASGHCGYNTSLTEGGVCIGNFAANCLSDFTSGSICYANAAGSCTSTNGYGQASYTGTGCCCGPYCDDAPGCSSDQCIAIEREYAEYIK